MADINQRSAALTSLRNRANPPPGTALPPLVELPYHRQALQSIMDRFEAAHDRLINTADDAVTQAAHIELQEEAHRLFAQAIGRLDTPAGDTVSTARSTATRTSKGVKLNPIKIIPFNGDKMKWLEFRDQFTSLVHTQEYDDHHKLAMLRDSVTVSMVQGNYTGEYVALWEKLCERYDDDFGLGEAWFEKFFTIPRPKDTKSGLLDFVDETRKVLRAFTQIKWDIERDAFTLYAFLEKLPPSVRLAWGCHRSGTGIPALGDILQFLEQRAKNMRETEAEKTPRSSTPQIRAHVGTTPHRSRCACPADHPRFSNCATFKSMSPQQRQQFLQDRGQCARCFGEHPTSPCPSDRICHNCGGPHMSWVGLEPRRDGPSPHSTAHPSSRRPRNLPRH